MALKNNTLEEFTENPARDYDGLLKWYSIGVRTNSLPQETSEDYEKWVARPVVTHNLAPRMARALLEIAGFYADLGDAPQKILGTLLLGLQNTPESRSLSNKKPIRKIRMNVG